MAWDTVLTLLNSPSKQPLARPSRETQNPLFRQSRARLAILYTGVMGAILALLGFGVYQAIAHAHEVAIDREIKSVTDTVHDAIEATASAPDQLNRLSPQLLPDLCLSGNVCMKPARGPAKGPASEVASDPLHHLQPSYQRDYYIRIVDPAGHLLATGGIRPKGLPLTAPSPPLQTLKDQNGQEYHQVAIALDNNGQAAWAYLMVGGSFQDSDQYLASVRWSLLGGLLLSLALVMAASWWLSALAMRPIYQSYSQIQQFTADAAHELRTPLAAIRATVESVLRLPRISEEDAQETLTVINRQNQRLTTLVSDLLLLSRLDSEQRPLIKRPCCLQDLISDIVEEMAALAISKEVMLAFDFQTPTALAVFGDEEQLYRLVLNLVNNAIVYTPAGGQVTLTLTRYQQHALISISDTGVGIALEHQAKIFDRFYRVDASRAGRSGSSGLGLAIAAAIAKAHSGTLTVTSQPGAGSIFTISLPVSSSFHFSAS